MSPSCLVCAFFFLAALASGNAAGDGAVSLVQVRAEVVQHASAGIPSAEVSTTDAKDSSRLLAGAQLGDLVVPGESPTFLLAADRVVDANPQPSGVFKPAPTLGSTASEETAADLSRRDGRPSKKNSSEKSSSGGQAKEPAACSAELSSDRRLFLISASQPYHGSTALEGVIMSSTKIGTLCAYGRTQCEGGQIMMDDGFNKKHGMWDVSRMLELYSKVWDLDKSVFFDKSPDMMYPIFQFNQDLQGASLPDSMQEHGIKYLDFAYTLMWRPICLAHLSSHAREAIQLKGVENHAQTELANLENFVDNHKKVSNAGVSILVINFADIIWRPDYTTSRLAEFLPCLGPLDADYVPKVGRDVVKGNNWKADGSAREFGNAIDPSSFYSVASGQCHGTEDLFTVLSSEEQKRATAAVNYLLSKS